jgi:hypothetical protein
MLFTSSFPLPPSQQAPPPSGHACHPTIGRPSPLLSAEVVGPPTNPNSAIATALVFDAPTCWLCAQEAIITIQISPQSFDPSRIRVLMDLQRRNLLACSINMRGRARGAHMHIRHHVKPNSEALVARVVLAHLRATFHHCTCELRGGTAVLIGYTTWMLLSGQLIG